MLKLAPAYLVAVAVPVLVAMCTVCERRTLRPVKAMMDRHGDLITDGCGSCRAAMASVQGQAAK